MTCVFYLCWCAVILNHVTTRCDCAKRFFSNINNWFIQQDNRIGIIIRNVSTIQWYYGVQQVSLNINTVIFCLTLLWSCNQFLWVNVLHQFLWVHVLHLFRFSMSWNHRKNNKPYSDIFQDKTTKWLDGQSNTTYLFKRAGAETKFLYIHSCINIIGRSYETVLLFNNAVHDSKIRQQNDSHTPFLRNFQRSRALRALL